MWRFLEDGDFFHYIEIVIVKEHLLVIKKELAIKNCCIKEMFKSCS